MSTWWRTTISADRGGMSAGRDNIVHGIPPAQLPAIIKAAIDRQEREQGQTIARLEAALAQATAQPDDDPETARLRGELRAALEEGDVERANALQEEIITVRVGYLTNILGRLFDEERLYAIQQLGEIGPHADRAVPALMSALRGPDGFVTQIRPDEHLRSYKERPIEYSIRESAACALTRIGPAAILALFAVLHDSDQKGRRLAAAALVRFKFDIVPSLVATLGDIQDDVRWNAAAALVTIGLTAAPELIEAFNSPDEDAQRTAMGIIFEIGAESEPFLTDAIQNRKGKLRANAAMTLGEIVRKIALMDDDERDFARFLGLLPDHWSAAAAVAALVTALDDADCNVQLSAVRALGRIGPLAAEAAIALVPMLNSHNELIQRHVNLALEQIRNPKVSLGRIARIKDLGGDLSGVLSKIEVAHENLPRLGASSIIRPADVIPAKPLPW